MSPRGKEQNSLMRKETLEKVTKGALTVFTEYGYHGATMKRITEATELSYGLVYHYFTSKEEVFSHLVNLALEKTQTIFEKALNREGTAWEKLTFLSCALLDESLIGDSASALFFRIMLQAITQSKHIPDLKEIIDRSSRAIIEKMTLILIQAQASGDAVQGEPVALVTAYLSLVQGLYTFQDATVLKSITPNILLNVLRK
jgi:AcrR family transcriptional regulator